MRTPQSQFWLSMGTVLAFPAVFIFAMGAYHLVVEVEAFWLITATAVLCVGRAAYLDGRAP